MPQAGQGKPVVFFITQPISEIINTIEAATSKIVGFMYFLYIINRLFILICFNFNNNVLDSQVGSKHHKHN